MAIAREDRTAEGVAAPLAGLQAGMIAALWMLAWMGCSAVWQRSSFWTAENLLASTFYGGSAIHTGFSASTLSGLALYLLLYATLGCVFATIVGRKLPPVQLLLVSVLGAVAWYYLSFHFIWKAVSPLVALLHAERPTMLGHVIYGAILARFPKYLPRREVPAMVEVLAAPAAMTSAEAASSNQPDS